MATAPGLDAVGACGHSRARDQFHQTGQAPPRFVLQVDQPRVRHKLQDRGGRVIVPNDLARLAGPSLLVGPLPEVGREAESLLSGKRWNMALAREHTSEDD